MTYVPNATRPEEAAYVPVDSADPMCPKCGSSHIYRLERKSLLEKHVYIRFGYFPWICYECREKFLLRKRHKRHHHHHSDASQGL